MPPYQVGNRVGMPFFEMGMKGTDQLEAMDHFTALSIQEIGPTGQGVSSHFRVPAQARFLRFFGIVDDQFGILEAGTGQPAIVILYRFTLGYVVQDGRGRLFFSQCRGYLQAAGRRPVPAVQQIYRAFAAVQQDLTPPHFHLLVVLAQTYVFLPQFIAKRGFDTKLSPGFVYHQGMA